MFLVRLELASKSGGILACLAGLLACLVALGLGGGQLLSLALCVGCCLPALLLVRLVGRLDGRQAGLQGLDLAGQLQAHQEQTAAILARLALPVAEAKPATTTRKKGDKGTPAE